MNQHIPDLLRVGARFIAPYNNETFLNSDTNKGRDKSRPYTAACTIVRILVTARKKQYDYYRDKLLTFNEAAV